MKRIISLILCIMVTISLGTTTLAIKSVAIKGIKLDKSSITLDIGKTYNLKVVLTPANTTQKKITYSTSNKNVATIDGKGKITAVKEGKAYITVTSTSNKKIAAKCTVTVNGIPGPAIAKSPLGKGEKVKVTIWYAISGNSAAALNSQIYQFNSSQNEVIAEATYSGSYADAATKVGAAILSKTTPNVSLMSAGPLFTGANGDYSMAEWITDPQFKKDDFFDGIWDYAKYNGKVCAIPYGLSTQVIFYNKKITDAAGLDLEKNPPKTWKEFLDVAKKAQTLGNAKNSKDFWGFDVTDTGWLFKSMLSQNGNPVVNVDSKGNVSPAYDDANAVEVANYWKSLADSGIMPVAQHTNAEKRFLAGNMAFIAASSIRLAKWTSDANVTLGAIEMPYFKKPSVALGGNVLIAFPKNNKEDYGAWKLIKHLTSIVNQTNFALETGYLPIRKSGSTFNAVKNKIAKNPIYKVAFKQMDYAWAYWHFNEMGTMDGILKSTLESVEMNKIAPAAALKDAAEQLNKEMGE